MEMNVKYVTVYCEGPSLAYLANHDFIGYNVVEASPSSSRGILLPQLQKVSKIAKMQKLSKLVHDGQRYTYLLTFLGEATDIERENTVEGMIGIKSYSDWNNLRLDAVSAAREALGDNFVHKTKLPFNEYFHYLRKSIFTLAPRGFCPSSYRLYEAMSAGAIPIYVWEKELLLPYSGMINWNETIITIERRIY